MSKSYKNILVLSDIHAPYSHQDLVPFLKAVKNKYKPNKVVCIGDEADKHAMSFHDSDPDLFSAGHELEAAIEVLKPLYELFPNVDVVSSNHGDMLYRKGKHHGIPRKYLRDYGDILEAPKGWKWSNEVKLKSGDSDIIFKHQFTKDILKSVQMENCCLVQGHYHEDFYIKYAANSYKLMWGMTVGCLIDDESMAFAYNKTNLKRPIIGIGVIVDGHPRLVPMVLDKNGRWNKKVS